MASLIDSDTIITLIGGNLSSDDEEVIDLYIEFAVGEIEAYLGRPIEVREFTDDVFPEANGDLFLHNTPVQSIISVSIDGDEYDGTDFTPASWGIGMDSWTGGPLSLIAADPYVPITVNYTAGLDAPMAINSLIANGVIRKWNERTVDSALGNNELLGVKQVTVEDYSVKYDTGSANSYVSYAAKANPITIFRSDRDFVTIKRFKRRTFG